MDVRRAELALDEVERVQGLIAESSRLDHAIHTANAMAGRDGTREVTRAQGDLKRRAKLVRLGAAEVGEVDQVLATFRKAQRIARRKRKG